MSLRLSRNTGKVHTLPHPTPKYVSRTGCEFSLSVSTEREVWPLGYTCNILHNATGVAERATGCHGYTLISTAKINCVLCKERTEAEETVEHGTQNTT